MGYEQRRRIRAQIRDVKKTIEQNQEINSNTYTKHSTKQKSNVAHAQIVKTKSPDRAQVHSPLTNGYTKTSVTITTEKKHRPQSPEKPTQISKTRSPTRTASPEKKTRTGSPTKSPSTPKVKSNRFNEYASAYMKKVGLDDDNSSKTIDTETKKSVTQTSEQIKQEIKSTTTTSKSYTRRSTSKDIIETHKRNGTRSPSPQKHIKRIESPERKPQSDRLYQRSPSPDFKRRQTDSTKTPKETIIKTAYDNKETVQPKQLDDKPSWVTNRNLKKITSETRSYTNKKVDNEKKYRSISPSKAITKPTDVITSSYGIGPLDADGRPLFGIKALRNGATNYQGMYS